jgi:hypothetical protein
MEHQPPSLEVDDALAKGQQFLETQIVGAHASL